jgi:ATP-binding cassette subfamily F protein 3
VKDAFYAQHQLEALNMENTVLEEMNYSGSGKTELELRTLLGCFLFSGDDVDKKIKVLSGGEKARVALAKTIVSKANFLLLDEPTNHLDMHSVDLLIEALTKYEGSYILVSHDRYFVNKTANKIWEIEDYKIKEFVGTYDEWERWKQERKAAENNVSKKKEPVVEKKSAHSEKKSNNHHPENREQQKELQKLKKQFEQLEETIAKNTEEKKQLEENLALPEIYSDNQKFIEAERKYKQKLEQLSNANAEYEKIFEKLISVEEKVNS